MKIYERIIRDDQEVIYLFGIPIYARYGMVARSIFGLYERAGDIERFFRLWIRYGN